MSFLIGGLLCARQYFSAAEAREVELRSRIHSLCSTWSGTGNTRDNSNRPLLAWSQKNGWSMNHEIRGWNECIITYLWRPPRRAIPLRQGLSSRLRRGPRLPERPQVLRDRVALGPDYGGPLFITQYSFLYLDPHGLKDATRLWEQNVRHTLINREHCIRNPHGLKGLRRRLLGLTASDKLRGYSAHAAHNDLGVITPTAALASFPYARIIACRRCAHFYDKLGDRNLGRVRLPGRPSAKARTGWPIPTWRSITADRRHDRELPHGPAVELFMSCPEAQEGLRKLGFESPRLRAGA